MLLIDNYIQYDILQYFRTKLRIKIHSYEEYTCYQLIITFNTIFYNTFEITN